MILLILLGALVGRISCTSLRGIGLEPEPQDEDIAPYSVVGGTAWWRGLSYDDIANSGSTPNDPYFDWIEYSEWLASRTPQPTLKPTSAPERITVPYDITPVTPAVNTPEPTPVPSMNPTTMCPTPVPSLTVTLCPTPCPTSDLVSLVADTTLCPTPCPSDNPFSLQPVAAAGAGHVIHSPTAHSIDYYEVTTVTKIDTQGAILTTSTTVTSHDDGPEESSNDTAAPSATPTHSHVHHLPTPLPTTEPHPRTKVFICEPKASQYLDGRRTEEGKPAHKVLSHSEWAANMAFMGTNVGAFPAEAGYLWNSTPMGEPVATTTTDRILAKESNAKKRNPSLRGTPTGQPTQGPTSQPSTQPTGQPTLLPPGQPGPFGREEIRGKRRGKTLRGTL